MRIFNPEERAFVEAVARLAHCNPFLPERIECERAALGNEFDAHLADWNVRPQDAHDHANLEKVLAQAEAVLERARERVARAATTAGSGSDKPVAGLAPTDSTASDWQLYEDLVLMIVYHRHRRGLDELIASSGARGGGTSAAKLYRAMLADAEPLLRVAGARLASLDQFPHIFAGFFQIRRAFENIFRFILGVSRPAVELRASVWHSIFTHDMRRYRRHLYLRMADYTTLITGQSGTGKELVAQAIGLSRYIPFDPATGRFGEDFAGSFFPVNLSALSPTLIESELFGHRRGSFTGAVADRQGWLEVCPPLGTVFLDEIGEVDTSIQVKLLRVLQSRQFSRLGETAVQEFQGKIIAATNRQLAEEMRAGRFRSDFYYRLCSDIVEVPSLHERIADNPAELAHLVAHLAQRAVGGGGGSYAAQNRDIGDEALAADASLLAAEVIGWIDEHLGRDYAWPGNIRELEQCLRNILIRRSYSPQTTRDAASETAARSADVHDELVGAMLGGELTADELLRRYCTLVFAATGSYEATARKLQLDRRTVRAKVDAGLLQRAKGEGDKMARD